MPIGDRVTVSGVRYPDPVTIGPYRVERRLVTGRSSLLYECSDERGGRVCVKLLLPPYDEVASEAERFLENARVTVGLGHPHVVEVLGCGREAGRPYVALELVDGVDLGRQVSREGPLRPRAVVEHGVEVAHALEAAQRRGLLHGDVRPRHLLLTRAGTVKLVGIGLSPRVKTAHGREIGGDPAYLAPERTEGRAGDHRADIYALGCSLFELLTGRTPFGVGAPDALLACHLHEPFPRASQLVPHLPAELDEVLRAMAAKRPNARLQTYAEVRERLAALLPLLGGERRAGPALVVEVGRQPGLSVDIPEGELLIGRSEDEGFFLDDGRVSRRHALLRRAGSELSIEDLGSRNGVRVNGTPVERARLAPGDRVALGDSILVVVTDEVSDPVPEAAARAPGASPVRGAFGDDEVAHPPAKQARLDPLALPPSADAAAWLRGAVASARVLAQTQALDAAARRVAVAVGDALGADASLWVDVEDGHPRFSAASSAEAERLSCVLPAVERALPGHLALSTSVRAGRSGRWGVALAPVRVRDEEVRGFVVLVSYGARFSASALGLLEVACALLSERASGNDAALGT